MLSVVYPVCCLLSVVYPVRCLLSAECCLLSTLPAVCWLHRTEESRSSSSGPRSVGSENSDGVTDGSDGQANMESGDKLD